MDYAKWKNLILDCILDIGDLEFQKKAWRGELPGIVSSYVELIDSLYDDYSFEAFVEEARHREPADSFNLLVEFNEDLNGFIDGHPNLDDDDEVLQHPEWHEVVQHARRVCEHFKFTRSGDQQ